MHGLLYGSTNKAASVPTAVIFAGIVVGFCLGAVTFLCVPTKPLSLMVEDFAGISAGAGCGLLCSVLPLVLALMLKAFGIHKGAALTASAFSCFSMTFSAFAIGLQGVTVFVWLLMIGRGLSLGYLFWFIQRPDHGNWQLLITDFFLAAALTIGTMLLTNWLTMPAVGVFCTHP